jgi:hypothetical protein
MRPYRRRRQYGRGKGKEIGRKVWGKTKDAIVYAGKKAIPAAAQLIFAPGVKESKMSAAKSIAKNFGKDALRHAVA